MAKVSKTFRLDSVTLRKIEAMAIAENRTLNNMVETLLKRYLKDGNFAPKDRV